MGTDHIHRVCTYQEAEEAIRKHEVIYLNDCFCRAPAKEGKTPWSYCGHTIQNCLGFYKRREDDSMQYEYREISREEALGIYEDWKNQGNMFRLVEDEEWLCCCCACGCTCFRDKEGNRIADTCLKSQYIERTDMEICTLCGECVDICAYDARLVRDDEMIIDSNLCYGCSACEYHCPENAITMILRK